MFGSTMRGIKRVKTSKGLLLQSKQLLMRNAWTRKGMASAMGNEEIQRQAFCQVTRLPAWLGNEWGEEPDKTLPAPFLRWVAEMCCIGMPQARLPSFLQLLLHKVLRDSRLTGAACRCGQAGHHGRLSCGLDSCVCTANVAAMCFLQCSS